MKKSTMKMTLFVIAAAFYIVSGIMLYKGYDKMVNYYNSEYSTSRNVNAYVGRDAYNYIINGNYATGFFVLSMGFMTTGTICLTCGFMIAVFSKLEEEKDKSLTIQQREIINE